MPLRRVARKLTAAAGKLAQKDPPHDGRPPGELVIITGMSGSGKASVLKAFEDLGYYCVDNLPVGLIPRFAELAGQSAEIDRTALVVDVREGRQLEELPAIIKSVKRIIPTRLIFLEASDAVLQRRYSETRRPHPLGTHTPVKTSLTAERRRLRAIRAHADLVIDTSKFNVHELRAHINELFQKKEKGRNILVSCVSFGFRHGVPDDADLVFDVRFLPNPHFIPEFFRPAGLSLAPLHSRRQELPDDSLRLHRRAAPLGHDRRRRHQAAEEGGLSSEGRTPRQPQVNSSGATAIVGSGQSVPPRGVASERCLPQGARLTRDCDSQGKLGLLSSRVRAASETPCRRRFHCCDPSQLRAS